MAVSSPDGAGVGSVPGASVETGVGEIVPPVELNEEDDGRVLLLPATEGEEGDSGGRAGLVGKKPLRNELVFSLCEVAVTPPISRFSEPAPVMEPSTMSPTRMPLAKLQLCSRMKSKTLLRTGCTPVKTGPSRLSRVSLGTMPIFMGSTKAMPDATRVDGGTIWKPRGFRTSLA